MRHWALLWICLGNPGSKRENKYSIANLQTLINKQLSITIRDAEDYGAYRRSFSTFSCYLGNKSRLSNREISTYFLQGLEPSFRNHVQDQLKAENPKRHPGDPYTLDEITSAALFYLSCNHSEIQTISNKKYCPGIVTRENWSNYRCHCRRNFKEAEYGFTAIYRGKGTMGYKEERRNCESENR